MLKNRVAVVTGGTGALGQAVVRRLVDAGARVHVPWHRRDSLAGLEDALGGRMARVGLHEADVMSEDSVAALFQAVGQADGPVEVLANLVGGFAYASLEETDAALWHRMVNVNATSAFLCARAAAPGMKQRGWGRIVRGQPDRVVG